VREEGLLYSKGEELKEATEKRGIKPGLSRAWHHKKRIL
jgi:hypothetical protein